MIAIHLDRSPVVNQLYKLSINIMSCPHDTHTWVSLHFLPLRRGSLCLCATAPHLLASARRLQDRCIHMHKYTSSPSGH